jgi:hypothetical protein
MVIVVKLKTRRYFHFAASVAIALSLHPSHPNLRSVQAQKSIQGAIALSFHPINTNMSSIQA